jgi:hypothetical protein
MEEIKKFKEIFWDAFHRPKLESEKFTEVWQRLEDVNNLLAGPLYAIYTNGHCDYFFEDKSRFAGINNEDDFLDWCTQHIHEYKENVSNIPSENESEEKDKQVLLFQTDIKMELAHLAYTIQKSRVNPQGRG